MRSKRHRQYLGADLLCCLGAFGHGNMLSMGRGELLACPKPWLKVWCGWVHPPGDGGRPQLCPESRSKTERTAKNLFSPLQPESISAFLSIGLQQHCLPPAAKPLLLLSADTRQKSPSCKGEQAEEIRAGRASSGGGTSSLCSNQGDGLSAGNLDAPLVPVS